ncbi:hypothetical protein P4655_23210, partial [Priestia megaterium]|uniref:hypothetical protein n=1 Tax=Priestia megaterium TaxID=1404 RepID=UPI0030C925A0
VRRTSIARLSKILLRSLKNLINGGNCKMGNCEKQHYEDVDINDLIKQLESENNRIERSFENIEGLLKRNEKLAEHFLGIRAKRGKY